MSRRDVVLGAAALLLLAVAIVRVAVPDRSRIRPLSVEACWVPAETIGPGQTITREVPWIPAADVYVLGWNPWLNAPSSVVFDAELLLYDPDAKTTLFIMNQGHVPPTPGEGWRSLIFPPGTGYRALKGRKLVFRYRIANDDRVSFDTKGAGALIYFVPSEGN